MLIFLGVTRDGLSRHFFHRPSKAYTTGTRKRRKIQTECDLQGGETRWHKTGKTRPVMANGRQKGCKKILVLYTNFGKNRKPEKTNWVMHQYHLGQHEEEREGELVVSKIFFQTQPRQCNWSSERAMNNNILSNNIPVEGTNNINEMNNISRSGSGSCSSSKEINVAITTVPITTTTTVTAHNNIRDELVGAVMSSYNPMDQMQHFKDVDQFSFGPYRKSFGEVYIYLDHIHLFYCILIYSIKLTSLFCGSNTIDGSHKLNKSQNPIKITHHLYVLEN